MAEGFSFIPPEDHDTLLPNNTESAVKPKAERSERFKAFISDLFRPKEKSPEDLDATFEDGTEKKGRFARAWRKLFRGSLVQKEDVAETGGAEASTPLRGLFFEHSRADEPQATEQAPTVESPISEPEHIEDTPESGADTPVFEVPDAYTEPSTTDVIETEETIFEQPDRRAPDSTVAEATTSYQETTDTSVVSPTERVIVHGVGARAIERHQINKIEQQQRSVEHEAKKTTKTVERFLDKQEKRPEIVRTQPEVARPPRPTNVELQPRMRPEAVHTVTKRVIEREPVVERRQERVEVNKERFTKEEIYKPAPEVQKAVEQLEKNEAKEIAYELSHEHKDLDKHSAAAWAALQDSASKTAQQNAQAIALAKAQATALANSTAPSAKNQPKQSMYHQAALGGFVAAVVIIAIIIMILLVQSK